MHERSKEKEMDKLRKLAEMLRQANAAVRDTEESRAKKSSPTASKPGKLKKLSRGDAKGHPST